MGRKELIRTRFYYCIHTKMDLLMGMGWGAEKMRTTVEPAVAIIELISYQYSKINKSSL
jgi:hypothetical protein